MPTLGDMPRLADLGDGWICFVQYSEWRSRHEALWTVHLAREDGGKEYAWIYASQDEAITGWEALKANPPWAELLLDAL